MGPERFSNLPEYAFPRLRRLLDRHAPGGEVVQMAIGEPQHPFPPWIPGIVAEHAAGFGRYPVNEGTRACAGPRRAGSRGATGSGWTPRRG